MNPDEQLATLKRDYHVDPSNMIARRIKSLQKRLGIQRHAKVIDCCDLRIDFHRPNLPLDKVLRDTRFNQGVYLTVVYDKKNEFDPEIIIPLGKFTRYSYGINSRYRYNFVPFKWAKYYKDISELELNPSEFERHRRPFEEVKRQRKYLKIGEVFPPLLHPNLPKFNSLQQKKEKDFKTEEKGKYYLQKEFNKWWRNNKNKIYTSSFFPKNYDPESYIWH